MSENVPTNILEVLNQWGQLLSFVLFGVAILIILVHFVRLMSIREQKSKYDFINKNIISQHQIKLDVGLLLAGRPNTLFIGTEIQWTQNGYGVDYVPFVSTSTDEFFPTILLEWVF